MGAAARFLKHKLSLFYPAFLIAYAFAFIITQVLKQSAFAEWVRQLALSFWNFLLLRMSGVSMGFAGGGEWYLSAMMLALLLIYPLLMTHRKGFTLVVAPFFVLAYCGWSMHEIQGIANTSVWTGLFLGGLYRAVAEISLGCICYALCCRLKAVAFNTRGKVLLSVLEITGYLAVLAASLFTGHTELDFTLLLLLAMSVTITFSGITRFAQGFRHPAFRWLGAFSLPLYLNHNVMASALLPILDGKLDKIHLLAVYMAASFGLALLADLLLKLLHRWIPFSRVKCWFTE